MDKSTRFSLTSLSFIIVKEKSAYGKYFFYKFFGFLQHLFVLLAKILILFHFS